MLKTFDKIYLIGTAKRIVLMLLVFLYCLFSASGQRLSNYEIIELINIDILQMETQVVEDMSNNKLDNWIALEGNGLLVVKGGNRNHPLIEQVRGVRNVATVLQLVYNDRVGFEYTDSKECVICQLGSSNYTEVEQFGNQKRSQAFQYCNSNEINIVQHGNPMSSIYSTSCPKKQLFYKLAMETMLLLLKFPIHRFNTII